jgi:hypothetical protein
MAEVYTKSYSTAKTKIFYRNEIVNADGAVTVDIYDITKYATPTLNQENNDPDYTSIVATKLETDNGTYEVDIPYAATAVDRNLKLLWSYTVNGSAVSHTSYLQVVTPYCDIANAIEDLEWGTDPSDPNAKSYHEIQMAEKYAREIVEDFTGQDFFLYEDEEVVYGTDSDILVLPNKIYQIYRVYANDVLLVDYQNSINNWGREPIVSESGFAIRIDRTALLDNTVYIANGMVPPTINESYSGQAFVRNVRYRVVGKFGWDNVPDEVEQATIQLMGHYFDKDRHWKDQYLKKVSSFDWNFEYGAEISSGTGCAYADKLLADYVITQMVVI